jgi:hypothetical protein
MFKIKRETINIFYIISFVHNIIILNKYINLFVQKYDYEIDDIIIDNSHKYIYSKLVYIFISQFQYSFISLFMLYFKYIQQNENIFIKT